MTKEITVKTPNIISKYDDVLFDTLSTQSKWTPRLQLCGASTNFVKKSIVGMGNYAIVKGKDDVDDLGNSVDCIPLAWRPKVFDSNDVVSSYNPESAKFIEIQEKAGQKDSGCMYGPEFLLYLPDTDIFVTFFCSNATSRREASNIRSLIGQPATIKSKFIEKDKYSWHGPLITKCSTPFNIPDDDRVSSEVNTFINPQESEIIEADDRAR